MPEELWDAQGRFVQWEMMSRDVIDVKRAYVHVAGDLAAGVLLSQIVYWFLPTKNGESKLSIVRDGKPWLAKQREEWWEECCITPKQFDRCAAELEARGLIWTATYRFNGLNVKHVSLNWAELTRQVFGRAQGVNSNFPKGEVPNSPLGNFQLPQRVNSSITETTAETTAEREPPPTVQPPAENAPSSNPEDQIPEGLALLQYATIVLERCCVPAGYSLTVQMGKSIELLAKLEKVGLAEAATRILRRALRAQGERNETINGFWLTDGKWKREVGNDDARRTARNPRNRDASSIEAATRAALSFG